MNKNILLLIILCSFFVMAGCLSQNRLLGKWKNESGNGSIEFFKDNTIIETSIMGIPVTGTYKIVDKTRINIEYKGILGIVGMQLYQYSIKNGKLSIINPLGVETIYSRHTD